MRIGIKVKPQSGRSEIQEVDSKYIVFIKSHPEAGKANRELVKLAAKYFQKPVKIISGKTSKNKVLEL